MNCFHVYKSGSLCPRSVLTLHPFYFPQWDRSGFGGNVPKIMSYLISGIQRCVSLSLSYRMCSWCNRWRWDMRSRGRLCYDANLTCSPFSSSLLTLTICISCCRCTISLSLSLSPASLTFLSPGGVGAGLLCPLRVRRVFKLYRSWQARGKAALSGPAVVDSFTQNEPAWLHWEYASKTYMQVICTGNEHHSIFKWLIRNMHSEHFLW